MSWTEERIETLRRLWEEGQTASQIAQAIGGISRNAVIGKAHRLGLQSRPSPVRPNEPAPPEEAAVIDHLAIAPTDAPGEDDEPNAVDLEEAAELEEEIAEDEATESEEEALDVSPAEAAAPAPVAAPKPELVLRSVGPGGFLRNGPGDQQAPIPPAPPRRLVPAKPSAEVAHKMSLLELNERICKWPIGHPGEPDFHFCGKKANPGFPYCVDHCSVAYQAQVPRRDRRPAPPLPYGGPRVR